MKSIVFNLLEDASNRFYKSRVKDMQDELEQVLDQIEELEDRRDNLTRNIAFCNARITN